MTEELSAYAHNLGKVPNEWIEVSDRLLMDIQNLTDAYQDDWSSQPFCRMYVRACWALIEGEVFCLKQFTLCACELGEKSLASDEHVFLSEVQMVCDDSGAVTRKDVHKSTLENLKRTLKIATSRFELGWTPDFGNQGWERLRCSLDLRDRITHPKVAADLIILDDELNGHRIGFKWFLEIIKRFQTTSLQKYQ